MPAPNDLAKNLNHALERDAQEEKLFTRMNEINELVKSEERDLTTEEAAEWAEQHEEYKRLRAQRGREDALGEMRAVIAEDSGMSDNPVTRQTPRELTVRDIQEQIGWAGQNLLRRLGIDIKQRDVLMDQGSSGGYLIKEEMLRTIMAVKPERQIIRGRAMVIPSGDQPDAAFEIPYFDQSSSVSGSATKSVAFAHRKENADMSESDAGFGMLKLEPKEQSTYLQIGKKTAINGAAVGLGTFLSHFFVREKEAIEDYMFINGSGLNQPLGMLNAPCKVNVTRNTSTQVKFVDVTSMIVKLLDLAGALWLANKLSLAEIVSIADAAGNNLIYQPGNITQGIPATMFGQPIEFTTNCPSLGTEGDLMLVNPEYYIIKDGRAWELMLYDVRPEKQLLDYVGVWDVDGAPWVKNAITFKDGNSYSPIVALK